MRKASPPHGLASSCRYSTRTPHDRGAPLAFREPPPHRGPRQHNHRQQQVASSIAEPVVQSAGSPGRGFERCPQLAEDLGHRVGTVGRSPSSSCRRAGWVRGPQPHLPALPLSLKWIDACPVGLTGGNPLRFAPGCAVLEPVGGRAAARVDGSVQRRRLRRDLGRRAGSHMGVVSRGGRERLVGALGRACAIGCDEPIVVGRPDGESRDSGRDRVGGRTGAGAVSTGSAGRSSWLCRTGTSRWSSRRSGRRFRSASPPSPRSRMLRL